MKMAVQVVHVASVDRDLELSHRIKGKGADGEKCAQQVRPRREHQLICPSIKRISTRRLATTG